MMPDKRTKEEFVVTWFPPDKPTRKVSRRTFEDAQAYIEEKDLMSYAPMIEHVVVTISETRKLVWNSTGVVI